MTYFSIIIPTYNRASFIEKTIASALNQSYANFELIVVDDGSTDDTEERIKLIDDERITYIKKENGERGAARNFGAKLAEGDFVYFLDSDDILYPTHLEVAHKFIQDEKPILFFQQYEAIKANGLGRSIYKPKQKKLNNELVEKGNFMSCHGVFISRQAFLANQFKEDRRLAGSEDYELWLRLAARYPILYSPTITSALVEHHERSVLNMDKARLIERKELMLNYILKDKEFKVKYGNYASRLKADAYSYVALHCIIKGDRKTGFRYFLKAVYENPKIIISKRALVVLTKFFIA